MFFSCVTRGTELEAGEEIPSASSDIILEIFQPDRFEEISAGLTSATFKTSVPKSALYINGEYHGLTPLRATGLIPGRYSVQIKKKGYQTVKIAIQVKDGISDYYYIEMEAEEPASNDVAREPDERLVPAEKIPEEKSEEPAPLESEAGSVTAPQEKIPSAREP